MNEPTEIRVRDCNVLCGREFTAILYGGFEIRADEFSNRVVVATDSGNFRIDSQIIDCNAGDKR